MEMEKLILMNSENYLINEEVFSSIVYNKYATFIFLLKH